MYKFIKKKKKKKSSKEKKEPLIKKNILNNLLYMNHGRNGKNKNPHCVTLHIFFNLKNVQIE
jgi:hypothetical protein